MIGTELDIVHKYTSQKVVNRWKTHQGSCAGSNICNS